MRWVLVVLTSASLGAARLRRNDTNVTEQLEQGETVTLDPAEVQLVLARLDNVSSQVDATEEELFNSTLGISGIEADVGGYGVSVGDYDSEAIPFEFLLGQVHENATRLDVDSAAIDQTGRQDVALTLSKLDGVHRIRTLASTGGLDVGLIDNVTATVTEVKAELADVDARSPALLARVWKDYSGFHHALEQSENATAGGTGGRDVRAGFDRLRTSLRKLGATAYHHGVPDEMKPGAVLDALPPAGVAPGNASEPAAGAAEAAEAAGAADATDAA